MTFGRKHEPIAATSTPEPTEDERRLMRQVVALTDADQIAWSDIEMGYAKGAYNGVCFALTPALLWVMSPGRHPCPVGMEVHDAVRRHHHRREESALANALEATKYPPGQRVPGQRVIPRSG